MNKAEKLKQQLQQCSGFDGDSVSRDRKNALDYYFQRPRGDEVPGRSQVVSGDVSAMIEAVLAQAAESLSGARICEFDPLDAADEEQAKLESEAVQYYVTGRENGFLQLLTAMKEALLLRNGVMNVDAKDVTKRTTRRVGNVEPEALPELIAADDVVDYDYDADTLELSVTIETTTREFIAESVSLENFLYYSDWHKPTLEGIPICALRHVDKRADLIALGFKPSIVNGLTQYHHSQLAETIARDAKDKKYTNHALDKSQELVEWYEVFTHEEAGDNGADELRRICFHYTDTKILEDKPCSRVRLAAGTALINPHRFTGISLFDKLKQTQDSRTNLKRAMHDNANASNKHRLAGFEDVVDEDDVADPRLNNMVKVKATVPDIRAALMPLSVQDTTANVLAAIESLGRERSEMGGAALDLQTSQTQVGGDGMGSMGLDRAYSVAEQLTALMVKTLASTLIRDTFLLAHATLREYFDEPLAIRRDGKWQYVEPSKWPERKSCTVKPGMSPGERARKAAAYGELLDAQMMLADRGMDEVLVGLDEFNRTLLDWCRMREIPHPEQHLIDPQSDRAKAALAKKDEARQLEQGNQRALMQQALGMEQLRIAVEKYREDADRQFKYFDSVLKSEVEEAKIVGAATAGMINAQKAGSERAGTPNTSEDDSSGSPGPSGSGDNSDVEE